MKIGILTHQYINNYGAFLQAWALREAIAELFPNDEVQIIDYVNLKHFIINAGGWFRFYKNRESFKDWMEKIKLPRTFAKARNQEMIALLLVVMRSGIIRTQKEILRSNLAKDSLAKI